MPIRMVSERIILLILFLCCSCATLRGSQQRIKVASEPPGAEVYFKEKKVGQTPGFMEIPRTRQSKIKLQLPDGRIVEQSLDTSYRWGDSFFANFIWAFWGAPVASAIDLISGAAWEYKEPKMTRFEKKESDLEEKPARSSRIIAIAPPQTGRELLSDELGEKLEKISRQRYPRDQVFDFDQTAHQFSEFFYDYVNPVRNLYRDKLYYELNASHILETQTVRKNDGILLHSKLTDIYTNQQVDEFSEVISFEDLKTAGRSPILEQLTSLVSIVPNTLYFDFTWSSLNFKQGTSPNGGSYIPSTDERSPALRLLTSFALRNSRSPKLTELKGVFRFIPDVNLYYDRFHFDRTFGPNPLQNVSFSWYSISAGFGAEAGLESPIGYFYLNLIPSLAWNSISYSDESSSQVSLEWNAEIGYTLFLSDRINMRLFGRAISGSTQQWNTILSRAVNEPTQVNSVILGLYGIAIGYYFPESKAIVKKALY